MKKLGRPINKNSWRQRALKAGMRPHDYKAMKDKDYAEHRKAVQKKSYLKHHAKRLAEMAEYRLNKLNK